MIYAFSPEGVACLAAVLATRPLLAFDIDGTLAPIVEHPDDARLPERVQDCLAHLARHYEVAIVTGRAVDDARRMFAFEPRYLIGNHGAEGVPGFESASEGYARDCSKWLEALSGEDEAWRTIPGITLED